MALEKARQSAEISHQSAIDELELNRAKELAKIESTKFAAIVKSIGPNTLAAMSRATEDSKAKLLQSLGLKSMLLTDGNRSAPVAHRTLIRVSNARALLCFFFFFRSAALNLTGIANGLIRQN